MLAHWFPEVPNVGSIKGIGREFVETYGRPDVITGGVPCQAISLLGKRLGPADDRWLWPEFIRVIGELRPRFAIAENPSAIIRHDGGRTFNGIVSALAEVGYDCWWEPVPAAAFGAGHLRWRICIVIADASRLTERGPADEANTIAGRGSAWAELGRNGDSADVAREQVGSTRQSRGCEHVAVADGDFERREGERLLLQPRGPLENRNETSGGSEIGIVADGSSEGFQGYAGNGNGSTGRTEARRPVRPADLRGRVNRADWWHEHVTGVPVLVHGLPSKLVEAYCRCSGNAIVPQAWAPIAEAVYEAIQAQETESAVLK